MNLELEVEEINKILNALSQMPYIESAGLIGKIQSQAKPQIEAIAKLQLEEKNKVNG